MMYRFACLCATLALLLPPAASALACDMAAAPDVPVIKGLDYDHARAMLLAAGWQPGHGSQFADMSGNQGVFHDRGYSELVACSFDQSAACHFNFNGRGATLLKVTTSGEENPLLDTKAVVRAADLGCQQ